MQPPVAVPAKGGPSTRARVARPALEKVTFTTATPDGSPSLRQPAADDAAAPSAALAAALSNSPPTSSTCGCSGVGFFPSGFAAVASGFGSLGAAAAGPGEAGGGVTTLVVGAAG